MDTISKALAFQTGQHTVDAVNVHSLSFAAFARYITDARAIKGTSIEAAIRRVRMLKQVDYLLGGTKVVLDYADILNMPATAGRTISKLLDDVTAPQGKIIRNGDGVTEAIAFELATPIPVAKGEPITELEFLAKTYGDIEDVLAVDDNVEQTIALLAKAKPVHPTLMTLPSWAADAITASDGVAISLLVLPRFLGDSAEDS